jgi:uncharacterized membrane protein YeaQ/YmgE (transglycosylase-associated protein family)
MAFFRSFLTLFPARHNLPRLLCNSEENMYLLWWIIVGLIAGWATGKIMKGGGYGTLMDIVIGIAGAIIGGFVMRLAGFSSQGGLIYTILVAILGGVILTWIVRQLKKA